MNVSEREQCVLVVTIHVSMEVLNIFMESISRCELETMTRYMSACSYTAVDGLYSLHSRFVSQYPSL